MTALVLLRADIALWSDPVASRVILDRLQVLQPPETFEQVFVRFEGDERSTGWRGEGTDATFQMTARFISGEHQAAADLLALFRTAHRTDPDGRLLLRTHVGEVAGLNHMEAVLVPTFTPAPARAGVTDISFTAQAVNFTLAV